MVQADPFAARLIERGAGAYAGLAAARFLERHPENVERFAPDAFQSWRAELAGFLAELAAAVSDGLPERFAQRVRWACEAGEARSVSSGELLASLECLGGVLADELPRAAGATLGAYFDAAARGVSAAAQSAPRASDVLSSSEPARSLCIEYLAAIGAGEPAAAVRLLIDAVQRRALGVQQVLMDVLAPAQLELGRLWHRGEIGVAEEHLGSAVTRRALSQLLALAPTPAANGKAVLVAVAAGDLHELGAALVAAVFELDGWRALLLGADLPPQELCDAAVRFRVDLVALSATIETKRARVTDAIGALRAVDCRVPVLVGGAAFHGDEATWRNAGADAFASDALDAVRKGRALVGLPVA